MPTSGVRPKGAPALGREAGALGPGGALQPAVYAGLGSGGGSGAPAARWRKSGGGVRGAGGRCRAGEWISA